MRHIVFGSVFGSVFVLAGFFVGCGPSRLEAEFGPPPPPSPNTLPGDDPMAASLRTASLGARTDPACEGELEGMSKRLAEARAAHVGRVPEGLSLPEVDSADSPNEQGIRLVVRPGAVHLHSWTYSSGELGELKKTLETERRIGDEMTGEGGRSLQHVDIWADAGVPAVEVEKLVAAIPSALQARLVVMRAATAGAKAPAASSWAKESADLPKQDKRERTEALLGAFARAAGGCQPLLDTLRAARDRARSERLPFVLRVGLADVRECGCQDVELPALEALMRTAEDSSGARSGYLRLELTATGREVIVPKEATVADLAKALVDAKVVEKPGPVRVTHTK